MEVQKTFYTPISEDLARKWRDTAPPDFEYTLKAPQTVTHLPSSPTYRRYRGFPGDFGFFKNNPDVMRSWENFREIIKILGAKMVVFQTPPKFSESEEHIKNIYSFFESIERDAIYGWEPRGYWSDETVQQICEELNLVHVVNPFQRKSLWGEFHYYRLHGIGGYRYRYGDKELMYLEKLTSLGDYVMFNNTNMWEDALRFKSLLQSRPLRTWNNQGQGSQ